MFDHFEGKWSPSWDEMKDKVKMQIFYNGGEVNPLISTADTTLRLVDTYQLGYLDSMSMIRPIIDHATPVAQKVQYHEITSTDDLKEITPREPVDMDTNDYIKHPIFYIVWNPKEPRKLVRPSFEWSDLYNLVTLRAAKVGGCVKNFEVGRDELSWRPSEDFLVPWTEVDSDLVKQLGQMYGEMPKVLTIDQLR